jgi:hypothetical protein
MERIWSSVSSLVLLPSHNIIPAVSAVRESVIPLSKPAK